jgi:hypothetical protein
MGQHFIDTGSVVALILDSILSAAGSNFSAPFDSSTQPHDVVSANNDPLIQYQTPGGAQIEGHAFPGAGGSIGTAINDMLGLLSPLISAYALVLPILGVIRGIIEIMCCLINPFCVIPAIIRLFVKWIPPFLSIFPPLAGIIIIISTIKAIIAIVFFILTELIPFIQLMIDNIKNLAGFFSNPDDLNDAQKDSAVEKLTSLLETLIQKLGILSVFKPLLDLIFLILGLTAGFPCSSGEDADTGLSDSAIVIPDGPDSSCCPCTPDVITDRNSAPRGTAILVSSSFGDCAPAFVFKLITGNPKVRELEQFQENSEEQLNCQLDEPIKYARPVGSTDDRSMFKVKLTDRRGESRSFTVPVLDVSGTIIKISSPLGFVFLNRLVNYEVIPDYEMLVHQGVIGVGCHPDVISAKRNIENQFPNLDKSALDSNPEAKTLQDDYGKLINDMDDMFECVSGCIDLIDQPEPAFDDAIACLNACQANIVEDLSGFITDYTGKLNSIIARNLSSSASTFKVDKKTVRADDTDVAVITVTPRDVTGALLLKNPVNGIDSGVEILTDFGTIFDQQLDGPSGTVIASIKSPIIGRAIISVKVNNELIIDVDGINDPVTRTRSINFTAEDILPTRRKRSKVSGKTAVSTGTTSEREPGNR